jgi:hypothetical protein
VDGLLAEFGLGQGIGPAVEDAAAGKAIGIDGTLIVDPVRADAGGHGFEIRTDEVFEIDEFGGGDVKTVTVGIKVATVAARGAAATDGDNPVVEP